MNEFIFKDYIIYIFYIAVKYHSTFYDGINFIYEILLLLQFVVKSFEGCNILKAVLTLQK